MNKKYEMKIEKNNKKPGDLRCFSPFTRFFSCCFVMGSFMDIREQILETGAHKSFWKGGQ